MDIKVLDSVAKQEKAENQYYDDVKFDMKASQDTDFVYVAFESSRGCKLSIKLKLTGDYTEEFLNDQLKQKNALLETGPVQIKKEFKIKNNSNLDMSK